MGEPCRLEHAPLKASDLQSFVTAAARRYSGTTRAADGTPIGRVSKWIAWNEPNNPVFLRPQFVRSGAKWVMQSPKDYARICNAVVRATKSVNLSNKVACGATSPRGNNQPGTPRSSVSPLAFLRAMKNAGATGFDAYAHHPYYGYPTETPLTPPPPGKRGVAPTAVTLGNFEHADDGATAGLPEHADLGDRVWLPDESTRQALRRHAAESGALHDSRRGQARARTRKWT